MTFPIRTLLLATVAALSAPAIAQAVELKEIGKIPIMLDAPLQAFDIGWFDAQTDRYILASRGGQDAKDKSNPGNNALLIIDAATDKFLMAATGITLARGAVIVLRQPQADYALDQAA